MTTTQGLLQPAELETELARFGQGTPPLSAAHGLMTAVIVGPEELTPSQWILYTLSTSGQLPEGRTQEELQSLILSLFGLYNDTVAYIAAGQFQPWLGDPGDPEARQQNLGLWCVGFSKGMQLSEQKWFTEEDKQVAEMLVPVFYFIEPERFVPLYLGEEADAEGRFELDLQMQSQLAESVMAIHDYWRERKAPRPANPL